MNKLEYFYQNRETLAEMWSEDELKQKEEELLQEVLAPRLENMLKPALHDVHCPISILVEYDPKKGLSLDLHKLETIEASSDDTDDEPTGDFTSTRSESIGFSVAFPDGTFVKRKKAKDTFIAALRVIGLARAAAFRGRMFTGLPLVSRTHRKGTEWKCQEYVDGWYVYVNMSNRTKMEVLSKISDEMRLGLVVRDDNGKVFHQNAAAYRQGGKRAMFRLNGQGPYNKRQFVYAAVKMYLDKYPNVTYEELEKAFPRELQGSYGVIARMSFVKNKQQNGYDFMGRYFTDDSHLLQTKDGVIFAVCTQWGDQFPNILNNVRRFGWTVSEE